MHDYDLLKEAFHEEQPLGRRILKWAVGLTLAFGVAILFGFLLLRAIEIESRYGYVWDEEQQTYFRTERGV